ncbi:protection of telomeres protein 1b-like isoform X2 [Cornus florida]|uniref:protection of telomeres protein 1b-like isoform X2 n=1 Tax=Cornus florida TaxID=4283 RepID=UPI0028984AD7|nr:protection of telomeres protein 1b-like isoform X2 [Cornus florida]
MRPKAVATREDDYKFLQLVDALASLNQKVNLIGVVVETTSPKKSKGTDCFCRLRIVDESNSSPGIFVNVFAENMEKLPHVESAGDIVLFSRVVINTYSGEVYALFNRRFSSFALFEGMHSTNLVPYQVSSNFCPREHDKKFIMGLRKWLVVDYPLEIGSNESLSLKEIREGERLNLICKVIHICEVANEQWMAFVWDGTDTPPVAIPSKLEDEMENPLPLLLEPFPLSRDILCTFPAVGTVLRVIVNQGNEKLGLHLLKSGRWVKFINIIFEHCSGLWRGLLMPFTKLRYWPNDDHLVLKSQSFYSERIQSKWARMPFWSFPWSSHIAAFPWQAEDFCSPLGTYRIRLTLEDPTARIHAFLYAEDGEKFFGGYPSVDEMTRKRNILLGLTESNGDEQIKDNFRNPPWVECCIKSYYLDKSDVWGSRNFRIFATKLK